MPATLWHVAAMLLARCFHVASVFAGTLLPHCSHVVAGCFRVCWHIASTLLPHCFHVVAGLQPATICGRVCDPGIRTRSGSAGYKPATLCRRVANPPERGRHVAGKCIHVGWDGTFQSSLLPSSLSTLHFSLFVLHSSLFILHSSLFTLHSSPSSAYFLNS